MPRPWRSRLAPMVLPWQVLPVSKSHPAIPAKLPGPTGALFADASAARVAGTEWRPLFGDSRALGFNFQWHDFMSQQEFDWSRSFHPGRLELCLNLDGRATLADPRQTVELRPRTSVFYYQGTPPLVARRRAKEQHRFITVEFAVEFPRQYLKQETRQLAGRADSSRPDRDRERPQEPDGSGERVLGDVFRGRGRGTARHSERILGIAEVDIREVKVVMMRVVFMLRAWGMEPPAERGNVTPFRAGSRGGERFPGPPAAGTSPGTCHGARDCHCWSARAR